MNKIVNILFYDNKIKKTPEEISIDTELSEIIGITFFTDGSQRDEDLLRKLNIIEHEEMISINIDKKNFLSVILNFNLIIPKFPIVCVYY